MTDEQKQFKKIISQLRFEGAVWIGEDGAAACVAPTHRGAWIKFRKLMRQDVGRLEALEIDQVKDITTGWLHLPQRRTMDEVSCECGCHSSLSSDAEMKRFGCDICKDAHEPDSEYEWWVSYKEKTPYEVWVLKA
jgi:hypothetical protein